MRGCAPLRQVRDPLYLLSSEAERAVWASQNLPTDRVSVANGCIASNCARWPLMIDPQLQGITWLKKKEEGCSILRLGQKELLPFFPAQCSRLCNYQRRRPIGGNPSLAKF